MLLTIIALIAIIVLITGVIIRLRQNASHASRRSLQQEPELANGNSDQELGLETVTLKRTETVHKEVPTEYVVFHVMAPKDYPYNGYELLQTLLASGLRYGEKQIFHRHESKTGKGRILFSLASVNKPGTFELSKMGSFTCPGLTLFMPLQRQVDISAAFETLLETTRQLAEDLGGEVWDDKRQVLTMQTVTELRARIRRFEEAARTNDFFMDQSVEP